MLMPQSPQKVSVTESKLEYFFFPLCCRKILFKIPDSNHNVASYYWFGNVEDLGAQLTVDRHQFCPPVRSDHVFSHKVPFLVYVDPISETPSAWPTAGRMFHPEGGMII
jgi:hypothetical protein